VPLTPYLPDAPQLPDLCPILTLALILNKSTQKSKGGSGNWEQCSWVTLSGVQILKARHLFSVGRVASGVQQDRLLASNSVARVVFRCLQDSPALPSTSSWCSLGLSQNCTGSYKLGCNIYIIYIFK
jgi:hypothetical protein